MEESFNGENIFGDGSDSNQKLISQLGTLETRDEELLDPVDEEVIDPDFASFIRYFNSRMKKIQAYSVVFFQSKGFDSMISKIDKLLDSPDLDESDARILDDMYEEVKFYKEKIAKENKKK